MVLPEAAARPSRSERRQRLGIAADISRLASARYLPVGGACAKNFRVSLGVHKLSRPQPDAEFPPDEIPDQILEVRRREVSEIVSTAQSSL